MTQAHKKKSNEGEHHRQKGPVVNVGGSKKNRQSKAIDPGRHAKNQERHSRQREFERELETERSDAFTAAKTIADSNVTETDSKLRDAVFRLVQRLQKASQKGKLEDARLKIGVSEKEAKLLLNATGLLSAGVLGDRISDFAGKDAAGMLTVAERMVSALTPEQQQTSASPKRERSRTSFSDSSSTRSSSFGSSRSSIFSSPSRGFDDSFFQPPRTRETDYVPQRKYSFGATSEREEELCRQISDRIQNIYGHLGYAAAHSTLSSAKVNMEAYAATYGIPSSLLHKLESASDYHLNAEARLELVDEMGIFGKTREEQARNIYILWDCTLSRKQENAWALMERLSGASEQLNDRLLELSENLYRAIWDRAPDNIEGQRKVGEGIGLNAATVDGLQQLWKWRSDYTSTPAAKEKVPPKSERVAFFISIDNNSMPLMREAQIKWLEGAAQKLRQNRVYSSSAQQSENSAEERFVNAFLDACGRVQNTSNFQMVNVLGGSRVSVDSIDRRIALETVPGMRRLLADKTITQAKFNAEIINLARQTGMGRTIEESIGEIPVIAEAGAAAKPTVAADPFTYERRSLSDGVWEAYRTIIDDRGDLDEAHFVGVARFLHMDILFNDDEAAKAMFRIGKLRDKLHSGEIKADQFFLMASEIIDKHPKLAGIARSTITRKEYQPDTAESMSALIRRMGITSTESFHPSRDMILDVDTRAMVDAFAKACTALTSGNVSGQLLSFEAGSISMKTDDMPQVKKVAQLRSEMESNRITLAEYYERVHEIIIAMGMEGYIREFAVGEGRERNSRPIGETFHPTGDVTDFGNPRNRMDEDALARESEVIDNLMNVVWSYDDTWEKEDFVHNVRAEHDWLTVSGAEALFEIGKINVQYEESPDMTETERNEKIRPIIDANPELVTLARLPT